MHSLQPTAACTLQRISSWQHDRLNPVKAPTDTLSPELSVGRRDHYDAVLAIVGCKRCGVSMNATSKRSVFGFDQPPATAICTRSVGAFAMAHRPCASVAESSPDSSTSVIRTAADSRMTRTARSDGCS